MHRTQATEPLTQQEQLYVQQVFEPFEHLSFETRNKYRIFNNSHKEIFYVAEQQKGILGFLFRQWLGHSHRSFHLHFFNPNREVMYEVKHPFRLFFQELTVFDSKGRLLGGMKQRFTLFRHRFDILDKNGNTRIGVKTKMHLFFPVWKFPFVKNNRHVATVNKKFSGLLTELMTDKDNFQLTIQTEQVSKTERVLILASAIFIDIRYFEHKR